MWLRRKNILLYYNQKRFLYEKYSEEKLVSESRTNLIPINSQMREEKVFQLTITDLYLQDNRFDFTQIGTNKPERVFKFVEKKSRPYEEDDSVHV